MEHLKRPIWRVPLVLGITGVGLRILTFIVSFISVQVQRAKGPDPVTGAYNITSGYVTEIMAVAAFVVFWAAGWKFVRGLSRRQVVCSATIMVVWHAALLALEQWCMATSNWDLYLSLVYRLWATVETTGWVDQILIRVFDQVSVPVMIPGLFTPYLYLFLAKRGSRQTEPSGEPV